MKTRISIFEEKYGTWVDPKNFVSGAPDIFIFSPTYFTEGHMTFLKKQLDPAIGPFRFNCFSWTVHTSIYRFLGGWGGGGEGEGLHVCVCVTSNQIISTILSK